MASLRDPRVPTRAATDTAVRHQVYLERLGTEVTNRVLQDAGDLIDVTVEGISNLGFDLTELTPAELQDLLSEVRTAQTDAMFRAVSTLTDQLSSLAKYEAVFTVRSLAACTRGVQVRSIAANKAYQEALVRPIPATGELLEAFVSGWSKKQIAQVNAVIGKGFTSGQTNQQLIQALRGTRARNYQDGLVPSIGRNAEAVVRTSIQHVANTARNEVWAKNSDIVKAVRVVATLDGNTTPQCRSLDGQEFPIAEAPRFPIHVRCRTTTVAVVDEAFAFLDEGATRSSEGGPVDAKMTYYEWLKNQPDGFQNDAIGPTRAKLLRDGGLTSDEFARLNLNRRFEPMTLEEMRKAEPTAFKRAGL